MKEEYIFDDALDSTEKIFDLYSHGVKILCPRCRSELLIVPDRESAVKNKTKPGIYCLTNTNHVCRWLVIASESRNFWDRFHQKMQENTND
jgi:hypothetical protein